MPRPLELAGLTGLVVLAAQVGFAPSHPNRRAKTRPDSTVLRSNAARATHGGEDSVEYLRCRERKRTGWYRVHTIVTTDNRVLSGLFRRDEGTALVFVDVSGTEFSVPKDSIARQEVATSTLMPDQFSTTLSPDEFNALLAYLLSERESRR